MLRSELSTSQVVRPARLVSGELEVPGDKSIAHRGFILGALAEGVSTLANVPEGEDVRATIACLRGLGLRISPQLTSNASADFPSQRGGGAGRGYVISSPSAWGLSTPHGSLDCANSGTTMRLLLGALAGSRIQATLEGDSSLRRRPMGRVIEPLRLMGARIQADGEHAPLVVSGTRLQGRHHALRIASAQVKSAILLAGLRASGPTTVVEPQVTRDHTERLLRSMGADIRRRAGSIDLRPSHRPLEPLELTIPGDFSAAAFWMAAAALRPGWSITIRRVGLNPTRLGFISLLRRMGAEVQADVVDDGIEPSGSVRVVGRPLRAIEIGAEEVAAAIDEIPALLAVATQAEGVTTISGAAELRVKESDRIAAMSAGLRRMGASVEERPDGLSIQGPAPLHGATVDAVNDHRMAMAFAVAALAADGPTTITDADCVAVSYPHFFTELRGVVDVA